MSQCYYCGNVNSTMWKLIEVNNDKSKTRASLICSNCVLLAMSSSLTRKQEIFVTTNGFNEIEKVLASQLELSKQMSKPKYIIENHYKKLINEIARDAVNLYEIEYQIGTLIPQILNEVGLEELSSHIKQIQKIYIQED